MLFGVGAGAFDWMPGSTPAGGLMTPLAPPAATPDDGAGGAICSGGVGEAGGSGPGGAGVLVGGLDGCAHAAPGIAMEAAITAARSMILGISVSIRAKRRLPRLVSPAPANVRPAAQRTSCASSIAATLAVSVSSANGLAIISMPGGNALVSSTGPA